MTKAAGQMLSDRLDALGIDARELAQIVGRPVETVEAWITSGPDAEGRVLLRVLDDDTVALRAVERIRSKRTHNLRGEDWQTAGVDIPYGGGFAGTDAGAPA